MWRKLWAAVFGKRKARPVRATATTAVEAVVAPAVEVDTAEVAPAAEDVAVVAAPAVEAATTAVVPPSAEPDTAEAAPAADVVAVEVAPAVEAAEPAEAAPVAELKPIVVAQAARAAPAEAVEAAGVWPVLEELERLAGIVRAPAPVAELEDAPAGPAMPEARFWALMEAAAEARADGAEAQAEALRAALEALSAEELIAFEAALAGQMARANRWDLWGAAYVALGGASDDGFAYARLWLIGQGREVFERVLADPDALVDVLPEDVEAALEFESLMYLAGDVWCEKTGREAEEWPGAGVESFDEPAGEPFEEDEGVLAERYPKLWKRFAEAALG